METNKIYAGNCLEVLKSFPDQSVNCAITSPPYNMGLRIRYGKYCKCSETDSEINKKYRYFADNLLIDEFKSFHRQVIKELLRVSPILFYNIQIVTGSKEAFFGLIGEFAKNIKDIAIWDKGHGQPAMGQRVMNRASELVLIMESDETLGRAFKTSYFERGTMEDIWRIKRAKPIKGHGACFPEEFVEKILEGWTKEGDIVLDPFAGTGTTLVVSQKMNRKFVGIELMSEYIEIIEKRLNNQPIVVDAKDNHSGKQQSLFPLE